MVIIDDISIKKDIMYRISSRHRLLTITISENKRRVTYHRQSHYTILIDIYIIYIISISWYVDGDNGDGDDDEDPNSWMVS